ncbi:hypothetical protein WUBG_14343, partial [Wuchereria bancrofti]
MKKSNQFQSYEYMHGKPVMHTGRRLPPTPILSNHISLSQTAPTTANSSPKIILTKNNS